MTERYEHSEIAGIWSDREKVKRWQNAELAVILARENAGDIPSGIYIKIKNALEQNPCDIAWWREREKVLHHDLNAWLEERIRFIPAELQQYFHQGLTSYDTEEPAFALALKDSLGVVCELAKNLLESLKKKALWYRYLPMNGRTHGQEAELQSFGRRCTTWYKEVDTTFSILNRVSEEATSYSKLSGATGNHSGVSPEIEKRALEIVGLKPLYGVTQIMPRGLYAPLASALMILVLVCHKVALDVRLGARSGKPLWHEPFGKKQKGSSAMPHKKNTVLAENTEGMARLAFGDASSLQWNIVTWEERAIEQSSVERVAWPDLFHVTVQALGTMTKVIEGLVVYPDNMLREIIDARGTYASNEAKEFLVRHGATVGIGREDAYRIVQLASFNAFEPSSGSRFARETRYDRLDGFDLIGGLMEKIKHDEPQLVSIEDIIPEGRLHWTSKLDSDTHTIERWNEKLLSLFGTDRCSDMHVEWSQLFKPYRVFEREKVLFEKVLGA